MFTDAINMPLAELLIRVSVAFLGLLLLTRIIGRKQVSQLTLFDYVTGIVLAAIAASLAINPAVSIWTAVVALAVWTIWVMAFNVLTLKSVPARKIIEGVPLMVIYDGKILEKNLQSSYYNINGLLMQLRENGVFDPQEVQVAIAEINGSLSILKKPQYQPVTAKDLSLPVNSAPLASRFAGKELILDGQLMQDNLTACGVDENWMWQQLAKQEISDITQVTLATITPQGSLYIDTIDDMPPNR